MSRPGLPRPGPLAALSLACALAACAAPPPADAPAPPVMAEEPQPPAPPPPPAAFAAKDLPEGFPSAELREGQSLNGRFHVRWIPTPDPVPFNQPFKLRVEITRGDGSGAPLTGETRLEVSALMPEHGHGMHRVPKTTRRADGSFLVEGMLFHMRGRWDLVMNVWSGSDYDQAILYVLLE